MCSLTQIYLNGQSLGLGLCCFVIIAQLLVPNLFILLMIQPLTFIMGGFSLSMAWEFIKTIYRTMQAITKSLHALVSIKIAVGFVFLPTYGYY